MPATVNLNRKQKPRPDIQPGLGLDLFCALWIRLRLPSIHTQPLSFCLFAIVDLHIGTESVCVCVREREHQQRREKEGEGA
jgi:hypothetical protein